MRSFRKWGTAVALLASAVAVRAELSEWVQHLAVETGLRGVFFREMAMSSGPIDMRRPPSETRPALTERIAADPKNAALYRLRGGEAELALDFAAAETDWKEYAQLSGDRIALADFYHRRLKPAEEIAALDAVATPEAFERAIAVVESQGMPVTAAIAQYNAWIAKVPQDAALRKRFIRYLTDQKQFDAAEREIQAYRRAFPDDETTWVEEAGLTLKRGTVNQAIGVFDQSFRPLMPAEWLKGYFDLLKGQGRLRDFLAAARSAAAADPEALDPVARMFHYYRDQQNPAAARRALIEYRARKKNWTADELYATARLFEAIEEWDFAARQYYALYSLPAADDAARERGLAGLANILLTAAGQPVHFGGGDLSLYEDIATMDPHPGFLNGILSLVLNTSNLRWQYDEQNRASAAYFHRARASQLLDLLDAKFPKAADGPGLHARLIAAYALYGDDDGVIRAGRKFLTAYPQADDRSRVALAMADAFARQNRIADEFAIYDLALKELAAKAGGVPVGERTPAAPNDTASPEEAPANFAPPPAAPAAPQYSAVLDRYIARLVSLHRIPDALALYRREIDHNPQDPGLYEKLAAFLDQNKLGADVEQVYKQAAARFPDGSWQDKLARWYLRYRRNQDFAELTRQVARIFSGTELERYFQDVVGTAPIDPGLYRQVNLYAHDRFPDDLVFVRNLLGAYARRETADRVAYTRLLRAYWYYDPQLSAWFFEGLSRAGVLDRELLGARSLDLKTNSAAARFVAEGEAWRSHFEEAAPLMRALAGGFPGDSSVVQSAATLERSLGRTDAAVALARNLATADPRDREALARIGDIYADRELFARARPWWNRMPQIEPGNAEGYLDAATVFWDYYRYDDALRLIAEARARVKDPALYAYQAGAIYEGKRDFPAAIREYAKAAQDGSPARGRLLVLARRPRYRAVVDSATSFAPLPLRAAVLEAEGRRADLEAILKAAVPAETSSSTLEFIQSTSARLRFAAVQQLAVERQISLTRDPVEKIRLRLALARLQESNRDIAAARRTVEAVARENPAILGVVRATTDFYWRNKMPAQAVETLTDAVARSNAEYRKQFTLEAARKSTSAGQFADARRLLQPLLTADPFNSQYLAAMADTYAQSGDDRGLRDFYTATIGGMKSAPLARDDRETRIAGLRRGLIPALTRLGQSSDAVDQYIELINRYPEDQGLIREAAGYASHRNLAARLTAYYAKASADSPKDYRWPMVAGRLETHFENFDAAIAAYSRAIAVRPDRVDLYLDRGTLEERVMRFAEAEQTYTKVWDLSYRDPQWLEKVAELQARQLKPDAAIATLRKAYLDGRTPQPDRLFKVAARLENWGLVQQAADFARQAAAGKVELQYAASYGRILARTRLYSEALTNLAGSSEGLNAIADAVNEYYSPEEKAAFAAELLKRTGLAAPERIQLAGRAGLYDLQARWMFETLSHPRTPGQNEYPLIELQNRRMRFEELGSQLEQAAAVYAQPEIKQRLLAQAAEAYASIGNTAALQRVFGSVPESTRYLKMVSQGDPARLLRWAPNRDDAVQLAIDSGNSVVALQAVEARGATRPPVWRAAYTALTSLYYSSPAPDGTAAFHQLLGGGTIGERLGKTVDRNRQIAGSIWFYYGARFGEYLDLRRSPQADDYLFAALEATPGRSGAYSELGDWYAERGASAKAAAEYQHALDLDPAHGEVQDRIAVLLWNDGRHDEAITHWKRALAAFEDQQNRPNLANEFWPNAAAALQHIGERNLAAELRPQVASLIRGYVVRHNSYKIDALLVPVAKYRLVDFGTAPAEVLSGLARSRVLSVDERLTIVHRLLYLAGGQADAQDMQNTVWHAEVVDLLLEKGDLADARREFESLPEGSRPDLEIRIAANAGQLDALLERYRRHPEKAPQDSQLRSIAEQLTLLRDEPAADRILDFAYSRALDSGNFDAANFLGLAQIRLKAGDLADALALLRRMQLVSGEVFENLMPAADLLDRYNHKAEAETFVRQRVRAVPWDQAARLRLGENLAGIAADAAAPYSVRVEAARRGGASAAAGTELALLARGRILPAEANQPYFYEARLAAARGAADPATRLQLLLDAIATRPENAETIRPLFRAAFQLKRYDLALQAANRDSSNTDLTVAREMAAVYERFEDYWRAAAALRAPSERLPDAARRQVELEIAGIEHRAQVKAQNEARRPQISAGLEQNRIVRPRIEK